MSKQHNARVSLADALRLAVRESGLSYNELRRRAGVNQAQVSRFMLGERDLTVQVASRLCLVLGFELVRTGEVMEQPLAEPPASTRGRADDAPPPETAYARGQGKRVDLEERLTQNLRGGRHGKDRSDEPERAAQPSRPASSRQKGATGKSRTGKKEPKE